MQIADNILRFAILADKGCLRSTLKYPGRNALVDSFSHNIRPGPGNDIEAHFCCQVQKTTQIAHGVGLAIQVRNALVGLVPQPWDVGCYRIKAHLLKHTQALRPLISWRTKIVKFAGLNKRRLPIQ